MSRTMDMIQTLCIFLVPFVVVTYAQITSTGTVCRNNTDCTRGQCCFIEPEFQVVSRRQALLPSYHHVKHDTGVCENYHLLDEACYPLETMNNHCGCRPGLSCQFVPAPTVSLMPSKTRRKIYFPGPGSYKCTSH